MLLTAVCVATRSWWTGIKLSRLLYKCDCMINRHKEKRISIPLFRIRLFSADIPFLTYKEKQQNNAI